MAATAALEAQMFVHMSIHVSHLLQYYMNMNYMNYKNVIDYMNYIIHDLHGLQELHELHGLNDQLELYDLQCLQYLLKSQPPILQDLLKTLSAHQEISVVGGLKSWSETDERKMKQFQHSSHDCSIVELNSLHVTLIIIKSKNRSTLKAIAA